MNMINLKVINFIGGGYSRDKMQTDRQIKRYKSN